MSMLTTRLGRSALVAVAAGGLTLGASGMAAASADGPWSVSTDGAASAKFIANGDDLWVDDDKADGHSAVGVWSTSSSSGSVWNSKGAGTRQVGIGNLTENLRIAYVACWGESSNKSKVYNCDTYASIGTT